MVNETFDIQFHFKGRMPIFKGKHGAPVQPKVRIKDFIVKDFVDAFVVQIFIRGEE